MTAFEPGDVVKLKSGGPEMTIEKQAPDGGYVCSWFAGKIATSKTFLGDALEKVGPKTIGVVAL
jgi:uncharacterized protein YodC (DUF2158 family)